LEHVVCWQLNIERKGGNIAAPRSKGSEIRPPFVLRARVLMGRRGRTAPAGKTKRVEC
jgi:hypothetical protein